MKKIFVSAAVLLLCAKAQEEAKNYGENSKCTTCALAGGCWNNVIGTEGYQCSAPSTYIPWLPTGDVPDWIKRTVYQSNSTYGTDADGN